jgi:hypothetical protein
VIEPCDAPHCCEAMVKHRGFVIALVGLANLLAGFSCSTESPATERDGTSPVPACVPGTSQACACSDARAGAQVCKDDGTFDVCSCAAAPELDASFEDAAPPSDASVTDAIDTPDTSDRGDGSGLDAADGGEQTVFTLPPSGVCTVSGWCFKNPRPASVNLGAVWGTSPTDIWAGGGAGSVLHYDGTTWIGLTNILTTTLTSIQGSASNDVWFSDGSRTALHWDGTALAKVTVDSSFTIRATWGIGATNLWAVGQSGTIRHWNGTTWSTIPSGTLNDLTAIVGATANDIYAAGANGTFLHWDGTAWSTAAIAAPASTTAKLRYIAGTTGLWAIAGGAVYHQTAGAWVREGTADSMTDFWAVSDTEGLILGTTNQRFANGIATGAIPTTTPCSATGVWGYPGFGYVVVTGDNGGPAVTGCPLFKSDGISQLTSLVTTTVPKIDNAILVGANDLWGISNGTQVFHGDGVTWSPSTTTTVSSILAGASPTDVWALGTGGIVDHLSGGAWTPESVGQNVRFSNAYATAANDVWALAEGDAWHWNGTAWSDVGPAPSGSGAPAGSPSTLWGSGPSVAYAAGLSIEKWNGSSWSAVYTDPDPRAGGVPWLWGSAPNDVWGVSAFGAVYHWDGVTWTRPSAPQAIVSGCAAFGSGSDIFLCTDNLNKLAHWDGRTWSYQAVGDAFNIDTVVARGSEAWVIGHRLSGDAVLLRRGP